MIKCEDCVLKCEDIKINFGYNIPMINTKLEYNC